MVLFEEIMEKITMILRPIIMQMLPYMNEVSLKAYNEIEKSIYENI